MHATRKGLQYLGSLSESNSHENKTTQVTQLTCQDLLGVYTEVMT